MMIWRGLDPKLLGRLLVAAAEALAKDRPTDRHLRQVRQSSGTPSSSKAPRTATAAGRNPRADTVSFVRK